MGLLDWLEKKNQERASVQVKNLSYDTAKTMLTSAMAYKLKYEHTAIPDLCKAVIYTRPLWDIGFESELVYCGNPTGFVINESISIADVIEHVVRQEWLADPILPDMPDPIALVELGAATARAYALTKIDKFQDANILVKNEDGEINYIEKAITSLNEIFPFIEAYVSPSQIDFLKSNSVSKSIDPARTYGEQISVSPLKDLPLPSIDQILKYDKIEESFLPFYEFNELLPDIAQKFLMAFFRGSENGYCYLEPNSISNRFGKTISVAYPGASREFITFAESFWTLKLLHDELVLSHKDLNVTLLYGWLEFNVGSIFFPAGGGHSSIPLQHRKNAQIKILKLVGFQKTEAFILGNPMLRHI